MASRCTSPRPSSRNHNVDGSLLNSDATAITVCSIRAIWYTPGLSGDTTVNPAASLSSSDRFGVITHNAVCFTVDNSRLARRAARMLCAVCSIALTKHVSNSHAVNGLRNGSNKTDPRAKSPSNPSFPRIGALGFSSWNNTSPRRTLPAIRASSCTLPSSPSHNAMTSFVHSSCLVRAGSSRLTLPPLTYRPTFVEDQTTFFVWPSGTGFVQVYIAPIAQSSRRRRWRQRMRVLRQTDIASSRPDA